MCTLQKCPGDHPPPNIPWRENRYIWHACIEEHKSYLAYLFVSCFLQHLLSFRLSCIPHIFFCTYYASKGPVPEVRTAEREGRCSFISGDYQQKGMLKRKRWRWGLVHRFKRIHYKWLSYNLFFLLYCHGDCWGKQSISLKQRFRPTTGLKLSLGNRNSSIGMWAQAPWHKNSFLSISTFIQRTFKDFVFGLIFMIIRFRRTAYSVPGTLIPCEIHLQPRFPL